MEFNPYQAPVATATRPRRDGAATRPTIATVFGILNLVFGGCGILGIVFTWVLLSMARGLSVLGPNPILDAMQSNSAYRTFTQVSLVLGAFSVVALIASGIGLLKLRPYGRTLAIGYGIYALIAGVVGLIANVVLVFGPMLSNMQGLPPAQQAGAMGGLVGGVVGGCVGLAYPAALLYCMYRPSMVSAFRR